MSLISEFHKIGTKITDLEIRGPNMRNFENNGTKTAIKPKL